MEDHEREAETAAVDEPDEDISTDDDRARGAFDALRGDEPPASQHKGWPKGKKRGKCQECGADADSPAGTWCAEHRPLRKDRTPNARRSRPRVSSSSSTRTPALETELRTNLEMAAQLWSFSDPHCAAALASQAGPIAKFW